MAINDIQRGQIQAVVTNPPPLILMVLISPQQQAHVQIGYVA